MRKVFIIHGRDLKARDILVQFLKQLGLDVLDFEEIANTLRQPFIADVVFKGIAKADAVVALFTPDEHSALYPPDDSWKAFGPPAAGESRWQARPNVIFEAGVALGKKPNHTIVATLGADVSLFSDLDGKHIVRLDSSSGPKNLRDRLQKALGRSITLKATPRNATSLFATGVTKRWKVHDETAELAVQLRGHYVDAAQTLNLLYVLQQSVRSWDPRKLLVLNPRQLTLMIKGHFPTLVDDAFWWLVVYGVFRFTQEDRFFDGKGKRYQDGLPYVQMSQRWPPLVERILLGRVSP